MPSHEEPAVPAASGLTRCLRVDKRTESDERHAVVMSFLDTLRSLVAAPLPDDDNRKASISWDARGRAWAASILRRRFRRVGHALCEPGGLPQAGIHRVLVCRPNHRLGNSVLISPLIA